jgi:NAD(P)-dependent dehydrogenase (short-subunit alcohol dehydrogenase family)
MPSASPLTGQVAVVTGGGRGLGRLIALAFAEAGAAVAVMSRTAGELAETAELIERAGGHALAIEADVSDREAVDRAFAEARRRLGPVALLVNNAAVPGPVGPFWRVEADEWWRTMEINLRAPALCARAALEEMVPRRSGRIINIVSSAGTLRWPTVSGYAVSKAALIKLTENLAAELRDTGVSVFSVHPGILQLGMTAATLSAGAPATSPEGRVAAWFREQIADGRDVAPERSVRLVLAVACGRADRLSGRYLSAEDDLDALLRIVDEVSNEDLFVLRLRDRIPGRASLPSSPRG